ncbi:MAG: hypothetical protein JSW48_15765 [Betaproteobacteria bacterium]|jgi:hypothetical protein|nr:MAG: hypothetical protein JSW48_15765 [Betaproteobacteria bacterium]
MAEKILACISTNNVTVARWRRTRLRDLRRFSDDDTGRSEFAEYLRAASKSTVKIIVDSIDEDYRSETLPHTKGADRAQLVSRKLRQLFRSTPYAAAGLQEQTKANRREDHYLFAALTRPELLSPWLGLINELQIPITGIYLLPVVSLALVERLENKRPNLLIVSKNESGLRQTFCKGGKLRVSRLTTSRDDSDQNTAFYAEEINSTRMYLDALTLTHIDDTVTVLVLDHDGSLADLGDGITKHRPNMECLRLGPAELQGEFGTDEADIKRYPDALHLYLLATTRPIMNLAPPALKTRLQIHQFSKAMYAAAAGVAGLGVLWTAVNAVLIVQAGAKIERLTQRGRTFEVQYQSVTERFPEAPVGSEVLRDSVEAAKRINTLRQTPSAFMMALGRVMNDSPNIGLNRIEWAHDAPELVETGLETVNLAPYLVNGIGQFGIVGAEVLSYKGDHQAALRDIRAFTHRLAGDERVAQVAVIRLPLDLDPNAGLNGSTATEQTRQAAPFEVAVVLKLDREVQ